MVSVKMTQGMGVSNIVSMVSVNMIQGMGVSEHDTRYGCQ